MFVPEAGEGVPEPGEGVIEPGRVSQSQGGCGSRSRTARGEVGVAHIVELT